MLTRLFRICSVCIALLMLLPGSAPADSPESDETKRRLQIKLKELSGKVEQARSEVAQKAGQPEQAQARWQLVKLLRERSMDRYALAMEQQAALDSVLSQDVPYKRDMAEALGLIRALLKEQPNSPLCALAQLEAATIHRLLGRYEEMVDTLHRVIDGYPKDPMADRALLLLGDHYFNLSRMEKAQKYYTQVLKRPGPFLDAQARYKLAWIALNQNDCSKALSMFTKVALADQPVHPADPLITGAPKLDLRRQALNDMTYCYSRVKPSKNALKFFARFKMSAQESRSVYERLARRYTVMGDTTAARTMYRHLLKLGGDTREMSDWQEALTELEHQR